MTRPSRRICLSTLITLFLAHCDQRVAAGHLTPQSRAYMARRLTASTPLWHVVVSDLSEERLAAWRLSIPAPSMAAHAVRVLRQALLWGRRQGLVVGDACARLVPVQHKARRGDPLSRSQLSKLVERLTVHEAELRLRHRDEDPLRLARLTSTAAGLLLVCLTGARPGAIGAVKTHDYDAAKPALHITTKGRSVWIALSALAAELLARRVELVANRHTFLFPGVGRGGLSAAVLNNVFKRHAAEAGVLALEDGRTRHLYDVRHAVVTLLREAGATWAQVAEYLGHSNARTVQEVYDHSRVTPTGRGLAELLSGEVTRAAGKRPTPLEDDAHV